MTRVKPLSYKEKQVVCCFIRGLNRWRFARIVALGKDGKTVSVVFFDEPKWWPKVREEMLEWTSEDLAFIARQGFSDEMVLLNRLAAKRIPGRDEKTVGKATGIPVQDLCPAEYLAFLSRLTTKDV